MTALFGDLEAARAGAAEQHGSMVDDWGVPPFSVLDTRQAYWQERRRRWLSLGMRSELGREADLLALSPAEQARARWKLESGSGRELEPGKGNARSDYGVYSTAEGQGAQNGTSVFDPVLCELAYRWWAPPGGVILDPWAGGSVRGLVAASLGHPYIGVDLSAAQVAANVNQLGLLDPGSPAPTWHVGDSTQLTQVVGSLEADMVFSCPPYYDLEVYSSDPRDLSAMGTYAEFLEGYAATIHAAAGHLRHGRFMVLVVGEIRDKRGVLRGFVPDTVAAMQAAGLELYNDAILVNSAGTLPLRAGKYMRTTRKLGRAHQYVLCAVKGSWDEARGWTAEREEPPQPQMGLGL